MQITTETKEQKMPIWPVQPVAALPHVTLDAWAVFEVAMDGEDKPLTRHFVGFSRERHHGQVSTPVKVFDPSTRCGVTRSGRVYQLAGYPGSDADARYVWGIWKAVNSIEHERDISDEVFAEICCKAS
jgi:hypothetical protein